MAGRGKCSFVQFIQQSPYIQAVGVHGEFSLFVLWPLIPGPVPIQFDPIAIGIVQVQRFGNAMVAGAGEGIFCIDEPLKSYGQVFSFGVKYGGVKESRRLLRGRWLAFAVPCIEPYVMVIAAGRDKGGFRAIADHELESKQSAIKVHRSLKIADLKMYMSNPCSGGNDIIIHAIKVRRSGPSEPVAEGRTTLTNKCPFWYVANILSTTK